ncbi:hypothetical protein XH88_23770 [Bradyrhizobium sp. CCBAU 51627]|nr:hypothetical protein [Bradyrhizobium sp. CCBAU 51627]
MLLAIKQRAVKEPLPDVPALAGASVHAFRKPDAQEIIPFQDVRKDLPEKEGKSIGRWGVGRGQAARRLASSCPRLQAPAGNFDFSTA